MRECAEEVSMHPAEGVSFGFSLLLLIGIVPLVTLGYLLIPSFGAKPRAGNARAGNVNFSWIRTLSFYF